MEDSGSTKYGSMKIIPDEDGKSYWYIQTSTDPNYPKWEKITISPEDNCVSSNTTTK